MLTEWPAPTPEVELLDQVHRRARVITSRRMVARTVPAAFAVVVVAVSLLAGTGTRPSAVRVAGEGAPVPSGEEAAATTDDRSGSSRPGSADDPESGMSIGTKPIGDETIEVRPQTLPVPRNEDPAPMRGSHLVNDPEGDDRPDNDGIDLRAADLAYDEGNDALGVTIGVTDLGNAPVGVEYRFSLYYDDIWYSISALRQKNYPAVVRVSDRECSSCSVAYDVGRNEVRMVVPRAVLNDRIASDSPRHYGAAWPTGHPQSPPLARGSTLERFEVDAYVLRGGTLDGSDPSQPHDDANGNTSWTLR